MSLNEIFATMEHIASHPKEVKDKYLELGKKVVLCAPTYAPEEIVDSFGIIPMGAWGADMQVNEAKKYFPAFICNIVQTAVECGMTGVYEGASAIIIPSLSDGLKVMGENWKYAVPSIPFIPMTYPQNRKPAYAKDYTKAGYKRIIEAMEKIYGEAFDETKLAASIRTYNEHNRLMRKAAALMAQHPEVSAAKRSAVFKSATFITKAEHNELLKKLIAELEKSEPSKEEKVKIVTTGILADSPSLLEIIDRNGLQIVWDDVAAESRLYKTDAPETEDALDDLAQQFSDRDCDSLLYDADKKRIDLIVEKAKENEAKGVLFILSKFCDAEEFDYPLLKKACDKAGLPVITIEVDRQMTNYEQASTLIESFREMLEAY